MSKVEVGGLIILFGATGDLAERQLYPAFHQLYQRGQLTEEFAIIGAARTQVTENEFKEQVRKAVEAGSNFTEFEESFLEHIYYQPADNTKVQDFEKLMTKIKEVSTTHHTSDRFLYYYSIAPSIYDETTVNLKESGITSLTGEHRVIVEKPFGYSLESAKEYYQILKKSFNDEEIFLIDHFPGMDFVQNILATRFYNPFIEGIWNKKFIENIQINLPERLKVGDRGAFYDENGALLDMFQNHILQILSFIIMDLPKELEKDAIHSEKHVALSQIPTYSKEEVKEFVVRGQYSADAEGEYNHYRDEPDVAEDSSTETYIAIQLSVDNERWEGVPIYVRTGKALVEQFSSVDIILKERNGDSNDTPSRLTFYIEPGKGLAMVLNQKDIESNMEPITTFIGPDQNTFGKEYVPTPYENLLHDALEGDNTLFSSWEEVQEQWRITDAIKVAWNNMSDPAFPNYQATSFGPSSADRLLTRNNHEWIKRVNIKE